MRKQHLIFACLGSFVLGMLTIFASDSASGENRQEEGTLVYELRTYTTHPGKLPDLHKRFRDHTMKLFAQHGMKNIIYCTPLDEELKENTLVYLIAHKSREAADESWQAFINDPEWKEVYKESHKDGPLVKKVERQYLSPTDYSPMK